MYFSFGRSLRPSATIIYIVRKVLAYYTQMYNIQRFQKLILFTFIFKLFREDFSSIMEQIQLLILNHPHTLYASWKGGGLNR